MHGLPSRRQSAATCPVPFPISVCSSIAPSAVTTKSASPTFASKSVALANTSKPDSIVAPANAINPKPSPPAAPVPGVAEKSLPSVSPVTLAKRPRQASVLAKSSGRMPFCDP